MNRIRLAAGVLNQTPLDWDGNRDRIHAAIELAKADQASILCLPELCLTGYGCEDTFHAPSIIDTAYELLLETVPLSEGMIVSVGLPVLIHGTVYNVAALLVDGKLEGMVAKQHLAGDGIHYEPRWFKPWPENIRTTITLNGNPVPIGDLIFNVGGVRIGFEICEDAWVGERPGSKLAERGTDIILNPSASHFAFHKHHVRKRFVREGSRAFQVAYVYANLVGNESGRAIFDGDAMIASQGEILVEGERFRFQQASITAADVDLDLTRLQRARLSSFRPDLAGADEATIHVPFEFPKLSHRKPCSLIWTGVPIQGHEAIQANENGAAADSSEATANQATQFLRDDEHADWELNYDQSSSDSQKCEEFTRAVSLALFDYIQKSHSSGVVVSLSGGADSAAVAVLSRLAIELPLKQLGADELCRRFGVTWAALKSAKIGYSKPESRARADQDLLRELCQARIRTAYQATENSGDVTREAALAVANAIESTHYELEIESLVKGYEQLIESAIKRPLTWAQDDITLQNIQARTRSPSIWMFANLFNSLLLSTSNRSEAAVGYATMDGDTSGGLSPIAGIDKAFLRTWLEWMEKVGPFGLQPIPALKAVNVQQPTAELRPAEQGQTDEGDLMPYPVLDQLERWAIRDKKSPAEVYELLCEMRPNIEDQIRLTWIVRFFKLWSRNQWKRERYAPSFHLDDENLDPKTWCRFPILSGGYQRELAELQARLK